MISQDITKLTTRIKLVDEIGPLLPSLRNITKEMVCYKQMRFDLSRLDNILDTTTANLGKLNEHYRKTFTTFRDQLSRAGIHASPSGDYVSRESFNDIETEVADLRGDFRTLQKYCEVRRLQQ